MENVAIKGRGGNDVQHKNWKGKIVRIWITIIRHGGLGHEVQDSWPHLSNATPWSYELKFIYRRNLDGFLTKFRHERAGFYIFTIFSVSHACFA